MGDRRKLAVRTILVVLVCLLAMLQVRLWVSEDGFAEVNRLEQEVASRRAGNEQLQNRNRRLDAEVTDLKRGFGALEERARADLGLIAPEESFYVVGDTADPEADGETGR